MVDCIYSPHCTWKQCDYACPIFAEISYWMERCNIDIRNPVLKSDQAAIDKGIEIIEGGAGKLSVFRSKSPETATDTLAYCAICLHGRGTALKKGIYVLNYAEYIDEIKRSWQSKYESEDLQFMRIWSNSANYLIISGIDYVKFGDFECQTLLRLIQDRRNPSKSTYIVYGKENLIGTSDFFGRLLSIMKGAEVN